MRRLAVAAAAWAVLAALIAACVVRGWADLSTFGPRQWLAPTKPTPFPGAVTLALMRDPLQRAVALEPGNPHSRELLARWYELSVWRFDRKNELAIGYREQALEHLRAAALRKPGSPQIWARIAEAKHRLGALDAEFETAVANALRFGPWEQQVYIALLDVALAAPSELPPAARAAAHQSVRNGLRHNEAMLFERATRLHRLAVLCGIDGVRDSPAGKRCT